MSESLAQDNGWGGGPPAGGAGEGGPAVVPPERYDANRAKTAASLAWLLGKAYGADHVPEHLRDPFYTDQYEQEHIKPPVTRLLLTGELYSQVCLLVMRGGGGGGGGGDRGPTAGPGGGHGAVVRALADKGLHVVGGGSGETPITEDDLAHTPINMVAHLALMDALMMAVAVEMMSVERVVAAVQRFSTFSASQELPYGLEDAMLFWINKVNMKMREIVEAEWKLRQRSESPAHHKSPSKWYWKLVPQVRYRRDGPRQLPFFPQLESLLAGLSDGAALAGLLHYYCPSLLHLQDAYLREAMSVADSLHNLSAVRALATAHLGHCFYLTLEDVLYAPACLKHNVMVLVAELFWWVEVVQPDFVQPCVAPPLPADARSTTPKLMRPHVPISNATKRSFRAPSSPRASAHISHSNPDISKGGAGSGVGASSGPSPSHPLLPLRPRQQRLPVQGATGDTPVPPLFRSNSLTRVDGSPKRGSVIAWPERRQSVSG
ncbi:calmodulin-regulated spectrin-associated protein 1-B-like [Lethenteron reissneri]|uniref:calmodulin-regulated spectrin-associated protein 1-B-like n=1 Tax=Lethenteron reissneri TaxID=7753 RepID=UPI002AB6670E|nr:calmodulin-regulated spectrin-associated protein 1-B-like [Lethenteron reissneri]